jgi:hypothetical protein
MMSDNEVIQFPAPKPGPAQTGGSINAYPTAECIPVNLPEGVPQIEIGNLGFEDIGAAFNMRDWLQDACEAKGAKMIGGGFGMGAADIDVELEGCKFNITIKPI